MKIFKFGLVGCGRISKNHFGSIEEMKNAKIVICADIIEERTQ